MIVNQVEPILLLPAGLDPDTLTTSERVERTEKHPCVPHIGSLIEVDTDDEIVRKRIVDVLFRRHEIPVVWYEK
jgi:hypothetical protein